MYEYVIYCINIFIIVLEVIVLLYLIQTVVHLGSFLRKLTYMLVIPVLDPVQRIMKRSVMNHFSLDLSPYILLILLCYLERVCAYLLS